MLGALLIVSTLAFTGHGLIRDPDFWWHIRTGQWITEHMGLPGHDIYTFWGNSAVWTNHEWLSEVFMWLIYSSFGATGIVLAFTVVTLVGLVLLLARAEMFKPPYLILGAGVLLGVVAGAPIWGPRPQMLEFFFVALELLLLDRYLRSQAKGWAGLYALPLVMIVWVNLHGSWPSAFLFLGAAIAAQAWSWFFGHDTVAKRRLIGLGSVSVLCLVALLLTPNGLAELLYPFQTQGSAAQQALIEEWFSPDFHQIFVRPFEVLLFVVLIGFILKRPKLYGAFLALGTLAMALESVRHIALFVVAVTPIMIDSYSRLWKENVASKIAQGPAWVQGVFQQSPARKFSAALVIVTWIGLTGAAGVMTAKNLQGQTEYDKSTYPVAATTWLLNNPQSCLRIYNQYGWGGYMVYRLYGSPHRVYIFGEAALMGDRHLNDYENIAIIAPNWEQLLDQAQVDCVVYDRGTAITDTLKVDPKWHLVYEDKVADIFTRS